MTLGPLPQARGNGVQPADRGRAASNCHWEALASATISEPQFPHLAGLLQGLNEKNVSTALNTLPATKEWQSERVLSSSSLAPQSNTTEALSLRPLKLYTKACGRVSNFLGRGKFTASYGSS